jgi:Chaperone of endosialidase
MTANNTSVAGLTPSPAAVEIFGPTSGSNTSAVYAVDQQAMYLQAFNLTGDGQITVEMVDGVGASIVTSPLSPIFGPVVLTSSRNKVRIDYPGQYRFVYSGTDPVTSIKLTSTTQLMGQEPTLDLATALFDALTQSPNHVVGTPPIAVSGTGTSGDPYDISADLATNTDMENGTSAIVLVNPLSLSHIVGASNPSGASNCYLGVGTNLNASISTVLIGSDSSCSGVGNNDNVIIGSAASAVDGSNHVVIGNLASSSGNQSGGIAIGSGATTVGRSLVIGVGAGGSNMAGDTLVVGNSAGEVVSDIGGSSVFIGTSAGFGAILTATVTAVGFNAGHAMTSSGAVLVGDGAGSGVATISGCVGVGSDVLRGDSGVDTFVYTNCVAVGDSSGNISTQAGGNTTGIVSLGVNAHTSYGNFNYSIAVGTSAGADATNPGIFIGSLAGSGSSHVDVIVIANTLDGVTATNAIADHDIILGTASSTHLRTAGSVISGGAISASDERLKCNILDYQDGLDLIEQLEPITFNWDEQALEENSIPHLKSDMCQTQYGLLAQDVVKILPEIVTRPYGNDFLGLHYDRLVPILLSAVKSLAVKVAELEERVGN